MSEVPHGAPGCVSSAPVAPLNHHIRRHIGSTCMCKPFSWPKYGADPSSTCTGDSGSDVGWPACQTRGALAVESPYERQWSNQCSTFARERPSNTRPAPTLTSFQFCPLMCHIIVLAPQRSNDIRVSRFCCPLSPYLVNFHYLCALSICILLGGGDPLVFGCTS